MIKSNKRAKRTMLASEIRRRLGLDPHTVGSLRHFRTLDEKEKVILVTHALVKLEREGYLDRINAPLDVRLIQDVAMKLGVSTVSDPKYHINDLYEGFKSELQKSEFEHPSMAEKARRVIQKLERDGVIRALLRKFEKEKRALVEE